MKNPRPSFTCHSFTLRICPLFNSLTCYFFIQFLILTKVLALKHSSSPNLATTEFFTDSLDSLLFTFFDLATGTYTFTRRHSRPHSHSQLAFTKHLSIPCSAGLYPEKVRGIPATEGAEAGRQHLGRLLNKVGSDRCPSGAYTRVSCEGSGAALLGILHSILPTGLMWPGTHSSPKALGTSEAARP